MPPIKNDVGLYETEIDGRRYEFQKWGAEQSVDTMLDIGAVTGKPFGMAVAKIFGKGGAGLDTSIEGDAIAMALEHLTTAFFERKALCKAIIKRLTSGHQIICDGKKVDSFDRHYADDLARIFKVARACLEVQYANFFDAANAAAKSTLTAPAPKASTPET